MKKISILLILTVCYIFLKPVLSKDNLITIYGNKQLGKVNKYVFGNNLLAYDPSQTTLEKWAKKYNAYSEYGAGLWNPYSKKVTKKVLELAKKAGISILRFPGGCGAHRYNWKKYIGKGRKKFRFGIDEFFKVCRYIGSDAVITISFFEGTPADAADFVAYLNKPYISKKDSSLKKKSKEKIDWVKTRVQNGHKNPYNVKYFEIGNEVWHGDHIRYKKIEPHDYANKYIKYYKAMKAVDPNIQIGVVLDNKEWNMKVIPIIKKNVDFGILHTYPSPGWGEEELKKFSASELFRLSLGIPVVLTEPHYQDTLLLLKKYAGRDIPLAITEYNGGFVQDKPLPYRHCLGTALLNAEMLRIFMKPENKILMANYWNFANEYWGMVFNGFEGNYYNLGKKYYKRPNYFVYELYHNHFGQILLKADVKCTGYKERGYTMPYLTVNVSTDADKNKIYLMVINKNLKKAVTAHIQLKDFICSDKGESWVLNGPTFTALNEKKHDNVGVKHIQFKTGIKNKKRKKINLMNDRFVYKFEPHSLTAIEIKRKKRR